MRSSIPRLRWPKPVFKAKRAITAEEQAAIVAREQNAERRDFYELLWHTGASQSDAACLVAEDADWNSRTRTIGGAAFSIPSHRARWGPGNGVQAAVRWVGDFGRIAALVSLRLGGTGFEMRLSRTLRATGVGA